jgi:hypothetical protein
MKSDYLIWDAPVEMKACSLAAMEGWEDDYKLLTGESCLKEFPKKAKFQMDPEHRSGVQLRDSLRNMDQLLVVSNALRDLLASLKISALEFIPVPIFDHKKKPVPSEYSIVNPMEPVDCLVIDKCDVRWGRVDKNKISRLKKFVIDESKIASNRLLFRAKHYDAVLVHRKLATQIDAAKLTGVRWVELENYPEI